MAVIIAVNTSGLLLHDEAMDHANEAVSGVIDLHRLRHPQPWSDLADDYIESARGEAYFGWVPQGGVDALISSEQRPASGMLPTVVPRRRTENAAALDIPFPALELRRSRPRTQ